MERISSEKVCLFGGTFDPIHLGHTHIAEAAVKQLNLDRVLFLPCQQSPHKTGQNHASGTDRLTMCQLATASFDWAEVNDHDITTPAPAYSWRTATAMKKKSPNARLYWLMGTDQWQVITQWHRPDKLARLVEFIVFTRGKKPEPRQGFHMHAIHGDHPASATTIRQSPTDPENQSWLHPDVASYIKSHHLYQR